jgi:hypothetical protein
MDMYYVEIDDVNVKDMYIFEEWPSRGREDGRVIALAFKMYHIFNVDVNNEKNIFIYYN